MCRCGCRGWCSLFPLLNAWVADLEKLQSSCKCVVLDMQCDWPAWLEVSGGRFWSHNSHPCPLCYINQAALTGDDVSETTLDALPYQPYHHVNYLQDVSNFTMATCSNLNAKSFLSVWIKRPNLKHFEMQLIPCQVYRINDRVTMNEIVRNLEYNRKKRGRALVRDLVLLGLRKGWRLEPSAAVPDVSQVERTQLPVEVTFWIGPEDGRLTHTCPLFRLEGVTLDTWSIDIMHAWHLGPMQQFISLSIHSCLNTGLFGPRTRRMNAEDIRELALLSIKSELFQFYKMLRDTDPDWRKKGSEVTWQCCLHFCLVARLCVVPEKPLQWYLSLHLP